MLGGAGGGGGGGEGRDPHAESETGVPARARPFDPPCHESQSRWILSTVVFVGFSPFQGFMCKTYYMGGGGHIRMITRPVEPLWAALRSADFGILPATHIKETLPTLPTLINKDILHIKHKIIMTLCI